jgi:hypothetical protein
VRVRIIEPDTSTRVFATARINSIDQQQGPTVGPIAFFCLGTKSDLRTQILPQILPAQSIADRLDYIFATIGFEDPVSAYPPEFLTVTLARDPDIRTGLETEAYEIVQECAMSAGYAVFTTADGALSWTFLGPFPIIPNAALFGDCDGPGVDAVTTAQFWGSNTDAILNTVIVEASDPDFSAEAVDPTSVSRFGRRSTGFGFPQRIASKDKQDAQDIAELILSRTAFSVNHVAQVDFHTLTDPRWWTILTTLEIFNRVGVQRSEPVQVIHDSMIIGAEITVTRSHIEGIIYLTTTEQTL